MRNSMSSRPPSNLHRRYARDKSSESFRVTVNDKFMMRGKTVSVANDLMRVLDPIRIGIEDYQRGE